MRKSKGLKFIYLVISFVCISTILSIIPTALSIIHNNNITGIFVSNMNNGSYGINSNFYMSRAFDNNLIGYLVDTTSSSVIDLKNQNKENTEYFNKRKEDSQKELERIKNADYFIINTDTKEVNTNTKYKTIKSFKDNIDGECYVRILSNEHNMKYLKRIGKEDFKKTNVNYEFAGGVTVPNFDLYISIPRGFLDEPEYIDHISMMKRNFDENIFFAEVIGISTVVVFIIGSISIFLYKRNKSILFDKDSFWLKLSKFVPLEV
ncbi:hypothetical protein [Terrisporobacter sp.]